MAAGLALSEALPLGIEPGNSPDPQALGLRPGGCVRPPVSDSGLAGPCSWQSGIATDDLPPAGGLLAHALDA